MAVSGDCNRPSALLKALEASEQRTDTQSVIQSAQAFLAPYYADINTKAIVETQGPWIIDAEGHRFMDLNSAYAAARFGHCPEPVVTAVMNQLKKAALPSRAYYNPELVKLGKVISLIYKEQLADTVPGEHLHAGHVQLGVKLGGGDANDTAIRLALKMGMQRKCIKDGQQMILLWGGDDLFAGRLLSNLPPYASGEKNPMSNGFYQMAEKDGPLLVGGSPRKILVPFNDLSALEYAFEQYGANICGAFGEVILGEGGVRPASPDYLERIAHLCDQHQALMIVDEVQTFASTGYYSGLSHPYFAEHAIKPHVITAAKAVTSGVVPLSIIVARKDVWAYMEPGTDGSTFAGNPVACAAALATFRMIEAQDLLARIRIIGEAIRVRLQSCQAQNLDLIAVRALGGMLAAEFSSPARALYFKKRLEDIGLALGLTFDDAPVHGICLKLTRGNIMRITPSVMSDEALALLEKMLTAGLCE